MQYNIVVFTGNLSYFTRKAIVEINREISGLSWLILYHNPEKTLKRLLKIQWRHFKRNGWRWIHYQTVNVWNKLTEKNPADPRPPFPGSEFSLSAIASHPNMRIVQVSDIHAQESIDTVKGHEPVLGLSLGAPILRRSLFSIPKLGTINLHQGKLPDYRGMPPAFWELWNDEQSVGCSVHFVDDKLDTGDLVKQTTVKRSQFSTLRGLQLQLSEVGIDLIRESVVEILRGTAKHFPQPTHGTTYSGPTLSQLAVLERRLTLAQTSKPQFFKRLIKASGSAVAWNAWHLGIKRLMTPRITVLLYHRVSDEARDSLTVGIEQFDRQMALLRKHFLPFSIEQVLENPVVPRSDKPLIAVTFDDGYLDNYVNAFPVLMRHGIPAAFFVSTGIIDSGGRFSHDVRLGNPYIPVMEWNHLKKMADRGYTVGSHTVNHIDCAKEPEETVLNELKQSRDTLQRELGISNPLFAYPYGGREHMTPHRLELVKQAGYSGCLSFYGGSNVGTVDRYNILRQGIYYGFSDQEFLFRCLGLI